MSLWGCCLRMSEIVLRLCTLGGEEGVELPKKKSKLDPDRVKQVIDAKSSHDWEVQEVCACVGVGGCRCGGWVGGCRCGCGWVGGCVWVSVWWVGVWVCVCVWVCSCSCMKNVAHISTTGAT